MIEAIQTYYGQDKNTCAHCGGSDSAKQAVTKAHEEINQQYDSLMNSPYLSQEVKDSLKTLHENTEYCWDALEQGKTCDDSTANTNENGPNATIVFAAANYSCYTQKAAIETDMQQRYEAAVAAANATVSRNGNYYDAEGYFLLEDNLNDNKTFADVNKYITQSQLTKTTEKIDYNNLRTKVQDLKIKHTDFQEAVSIIRQEGDTKDPDEYMMLANIFGISN